MKPKLLIPLVVFGLSTLFGAPALHATAGINFGLSVHPDGTVVPFSDGRVLNFDSGHHFKIDGTLISPTGVGFNLIAMPTPSSASFLKVNGVTPSYTPAASIATISGTEALTGKTINGLKPIVGTAAGIDQSITSTETPSDTFSLSIVKSGGWSGNLTPVFRFAYATGNEYSFPKGPGTVALIGKPNLTVPDDTISSSSTLNLSSTKGPQVDVTGTTTITAITLANGAFRTLHFTGATILTHGSSLLLPGEANIPTANGDYAYISGGASGVVTVDRYVKAGGSPQTTVADFDGGSIKNLTYLSLDPAAGDFYVPDGHGHLMHIGGVETTSTADHSLDFKLINADRRITLGGNINIAADFSTVGAFSATLTTTATTNSTLPAGTHTLASLDGTESLTNKTLNKVTITAPATGSTLTILNGKTATFNNSIAISGTDSSTLNIGTGGTLASGAFAPAPTGGVIGTAAFDAIGGISSSHFEGIISGVTYNGVGDYSVTFASAQANTNYVVNFTTDSTSFDPMLVPNVVRSDKTTTGFRFIMNNATKAVGGNAADPDYIQISVQRLSQ